MAFKKSNYDPTWKEEIAPRIKKRDGFKCVNCGVKQRARGYRDKFDKWVECDAFMEDWAKRNGIKIITIHLGVAHLDQDRTNNDDNNLRTLCQRCHLRHDHPHKMRERFLQQKFSKPSPTNAERRIETSNAKVIFPPNI